MESNIYYNALKAGENEAKYYINWFKNHSLQKKKIDSFTILYDYEYDDNESTILFCTGIPMHLNLPKKKMWCS